MSVNEALDTDEAGMPVMPELLPLDAWHRSRGGRMVQFAGYMMPVQYEGIIAEHLWTRHCAGLFDVSHMGQLTVSSDGPQSDIVEVLEALLPGDLAALEPGRMRYSLLLDEQGGVLDDLIVTRRGGDFYVVVNGATKWDDMAHLREHLPDAITLSYMDEHALLALQGPQAALALGRLGIEPARPSGAVLNDLKFMQGSGYRWQGKPLGISRSGYTGEDGFEISVRAEDAAALADALCEQPEVKPIGLGARDSLRLEAGLPLYGHDLTPDTDPISAGLGFAISKRRRSHGGFPGADRIIGLIANGPPTRRVGLMIGGRMAAREGAKVYVGSEEVGVVTSGGFSPSLERPIAMAYVATAHASPGSAVEIDVRGKRLLAQVHALPFVPHHYVR